MPTKEDWEVVKAFNTTIRIVNWRLAEVAALKTNFRFVSWPAFSDPYVHLLARDGLHSSYKGIEKRKKKKKSKTNEQIKKKKTPHTPQMKKSTPTKREKTKRGSTSDKGKRTFIVRSVFKAGCGRKPCENVKFNRNQVHIRRRIISVVFIFQVLMSVML